MGSIVIVVKAQWDGEAGVWIAESADLPGLIMEAETLEELQTKVLGVVPDLVAETGLAVEGLPEIPVCIMSETLTKVRLAGAG